MVRSPKAKDVPKAIIMVVDVFDNQNYVYKAKAHSLQITQYKENAYQYSSPQVAQTALKRILSKYPKIQHAEVFVL